MLKKLIILSLFQLLAAPPVFSSEEAIAKKQNRVQQIEKLKEHIPVPELQKIVMEYIGNEYIPKTLVQSHQISSTALSKNGTYLIQKQYLHGVSFADIWKFEKGIYKLTHIVNIPTQAENPAISNDGKYIAFETENSILIFELKNDRYQLLQEEEKEQVDYPLDRLGLEFFGNNKMLGRVTNYSIDLWELSDTTNIFTRQKTDNIGNRIYSAAFSSNGRFIATGMLHTSINLWKFSQDNIRLLNSFKPSTKILTHPAFDGQCAPKVTISSDGKKLAAYGFHTELFKMETGNLTSFQIIEEARTPLRVKFSYDNKFIAIEIADQSESKTNVWKLNPKSLKYEKWAEMPGELIGFSPNNSIVTIKNHKELIMWENQKEQLEQDTREKIKSAAEQEQTVVTEID